MSTWRLNIFPLACFMIITFLCHCIFLCSWSFLCHCHASVHFFEVNCIIVKLDLNTAMFVHDTPE